MRDIKFKIWDKEEKKFLEINWQGEDTRYTKGKANLNYSDYVYITLSGYVDDDGNPYEVDAEILQYTGLKDKDGKEIYEGDIVQRTSLIPGGFDVKGKVEYEEAQYWINGEGNISPLFSEVDELEVVGNIYENPELLEV